MIYLDNAATTLMKPRATAEKMKEAVGKLASPGRGGHSFAMKAADTLYSCRECAAKLFGVDTPENVVITMNATHALNIAIGSLVKEGDRVVVSGYEHNSVIRPLFARRANVAVARSPLFDQEAAFRAFRAALGVKTRAVAVTHVSNVFGFILPIERIAELCRSRGVPLIIDASQSAGCLGIDMKALGAQFIAMPGHKGLYGPQGTGILLCAGTAHPMLYGGSGSHSISTEMPPYLPDMLEAGTHNMPGIAGLKEGLDFVTRTGPETIFRHEKKLIDFAIDELGGMQKLKLFYDPKRVAQSGVLSLTVDGMDSETVGEKLAERGIAVRAGLHCSPAAHRTAGTIKGGTVRISVSYFNTESDIIRLVTALKRL